MSEHDFRVSGEFKRKTIDFLQAEGSPDFPVSVIELFSNVKIYVLHEIVSDAASKETASDEFNRAIQKGFDLVHTFDSIARVVAQDTEFERKAGSPTRADVEAIRNLPDTIGDIVQHYADVLPPDIIAAASEIERRYTRVFSGHSRFAG